MSVGPDRAGAAFDGYVMVDWSAASVRRTGADSIWIAALSGDALRLENPATREAAMQIVQDLLARATDQGQRLLVGFDFAFGYPSGLAQALAANGDWATVWARIAAGLQDGPDNANTRFDLAADLNAAFPGDGPFWGNGLTRDIPGLPRKKPSGWGDTLPANLRDADSRASAAQEVWKLSGAGSVGGQALTGIARLETLRQATGAQVWPFETLGDGSSHVMAEVFPSLVPMTFPEAAVRDAVQVEVTARALAHLDASGDLLALLRAPAALPPEVRSHEGSILGLDHQDQLAEAVRAVQAATPPSAPRLARTSARPVPPYEHDPAAIYAESFATVRREARLDRFPQGLQSMAIRLIHACGMVDVADRLAFSAGAWDAGRAAMLSGKPVLCDCEMVGAGIIRRSLPAENPVIVTLNDPSVPDRARAIGNTRSAAAVELWEPYLDGAVVAIGNAPTALFHLLDLIGQGAPKPAVILGFPVGFVGAAESKAELAAHPRGCDFVALRGRRGGSAMASAAVNALAAGLPGEQL
ncbi:precorrin-8X methylmutase [Pseudooceanicola nitratireducens]|jgi:precorrin-8X/cobalt-precorrin-8 methylmutase|uniref:Precorrin-8X methylmutase n=1 Tax=Pseudooceanicola nitratireducens TaxID=517719 RepID=A0A1I1IK06_9RHOB|nr:precorrin-8X methylmutase [Pseudooceanicola nitratireducens]SFC34103.1 precorrin-8X methylmutase [Pseudooceanicola nitratireducens]